MNDSTKDKKIWIDLDNSPHVPFFRPIIRELENKSCDVVVTARKAFQVIGLADKCGLKYRAIGRHHGKNKLIKLCGLVLRALQMIPMILQEKPDLAVSHGSRAQLITCFLLGIPCVTIFDYEYAKGLVVVHPDWVFVPEVISETNLKDNWKGTKVFRYPGIKEDVYVPEFLPDPRIKDELGIDDDKIVVTIRPPATEAHYFVQESETLFEMAIDFLERNQNICILMLPRNEKQEKFIRRKWSALCESKRMVVPKSVVDGLNLMWFSDLVISGGGTMNREAAALNVPVYSVFRGATGAVDRYLEAQGRLVMLKSKEDLETRVRLIKRDNSARMDQEPSVVLQSIVGKLNEIVLTNIAKTN